jgi:hypothetical protein
MLKPTGLTELTAPVPQHQDAAAWTPRRHVVAWDGAHAGQNIGLAFVDRDVRRRRVVGNTYEVPWSFTYPAFSPDGHWLAARSIPDTWVTVHSET